MILPFFYTYFTQFLLFSKQCHRNIHRIFETSGDLEINSGLATLEESFGELREDEVVFRRVYSTGVFHVPVPVIENKLYIRIDTYLRIGTGIGSIDSLNCCIITSFVILDVSHLDVIEY